MQSHPKMWTILRTTDSILERGYTGAPGFFTMEFYKGITGKLP